MIPSSITYEHVIKALNQIDEEDIPEERKSTKYDLLYQEKRYPPKLVISKANIYACGKELNASKFSGGKETNNYLLGLGFEIVRRESVKLNPDWVRDELILALNLYFNYPEKKSFSKDHSAVVELSEILRRLPIHKYRPDEKSFRNPAGVEMKLHNFSRLDKKGGLGHGSKLEAVIWNEYHSDKLLLEKLANKIIESSLSPDLENTLSDLVEQEEEFPEGQIIYSMHRRRERSKMLVKKAKDERKKKVDVLKCDVCDFNFSHFYGAIGADYIECHHKKPVSELKNDEKTKIEDLALVCANCHRMLHRKRPWLSIEQLKQLVQDASSGRLY